MLALHHNRPAVRAAQINVMGEYWRVHNRRGVESPKGFFRFYHLQTAKNSVIQNVPHLRGSVRCCQWAGHLSLLGATKKLKEEGRALIERILLRESLMAFGHIDALNTARRGLIERLVLIGKNAAEGDIAVLALIRRLPRRRQGHPVGRAVNLHRVPTSIGDIPAPKSKFSFCCLSNGPRIRHFGHRHAATHEDSCAVTGSGGDWLPHLGYLRWGRQGLPVGRLSVESPSRLHAKPLTVSWQPIPRDLQFAFAIKPITIATGGAVEPHGNAILGRCLNRLPHLSLLLNLHHPNAAHTGERSIDRCKLAQRPLCLLPREVHITQERGGSRVYRHNSPPLYQRRHLSLLLGRGFGRFGGGEGVANLLRLLIDGKGILYRLRHILSHGVSDPRHFLFEAGPDTQKHVFRLVFPGHDRIVDGIRGHLQTHCHLLFFLLAKMHIQVYHPFVNTHTVSDSDFLRKLQ